MRSPPLLAAALLAWLPLAAAWADETPVHLHAGSHPGYGRLVFDLPTHSDYRISQDGQNVSLHFSGRLTMPPGIALPHNVVRITGGTDQSDLVLATGAVAIDWRLGDYLVIDVYDHDAPQARNAANARATAATSPAPPATSPDAPVSPPPQPKNAALPLPTTPSVPAPSAPQPAAPAPAAAAPAPEPPAADEPAAPPANLPLVKSIKTERPAGVAAFRRGDLALVVIDQRIALDAPGPNDPPPFDRASVVTLPAATVLEIPLEPNQALSLTQSENGWQIAVVGAEANLQPIRPTADGGRIELSAATVGGIVSLNDPETGSTLLVGTQHRPGQGVAVERRATGFALLPTWQGVAVEALGDELAMRPALDGFMLSGGAAGLILSPPTDVMDMLTHAAGLTRRFDFTDAPVPVLMQRLRRQMAEEVETPMLSRAPRRLKTAQTMISLGLGAEAEALLQLNADDGMRATEGADTAALLSIAAVLADRPGEADSLASETPPDSDETAFWGAVRRAELQPGSPRAAAALAATMPLLFAYPVALLERLLPPLTQTLIAGGETATAAAVLARRPADSSLDVARGMLKEAQGDGPAAQAMYEKAARSGNRWLHAQGAVHAVEMRLANGKLDARAAADALDKLLYAWRGGRWERALRERLAALRTRTGAWRTALTLLRDGEASLPDDSKELHDELADTFAAMLRENAMQAMSPLELVSLVEENTDVLPDGPDQEALQARLADQLLALDLPARAGPVLVRLMKAAPTAAGRAGFGLRLAALRLREGDTDGAKAALQDSDADGLPAALIEARTLVASAGLARRGDTAGALAALSGLDTPGADEARASILERANDWPGAQKALTAYAARTVPSEGRLDEAQRRTLLRLATAEARAGDQAALTELGQREAGRMQSGPLADVFRLLAAPKVQGVADLKRSGQEAALARALPAELKKLTPPPH